MHGAAFSCTALLLRHGVTAEMLGLIGPKKLGPNDIVNMVDGDAAVKEARRRADPGVPGSMRDLVAARIAAQRRAGIGVDEVAPIYTSQAEGYLTPIIFKLGSQGGLAGPLGIISTDAAGTVAWMRQDLSRLYGDQADAVLAYALRIYPYGDEPNVKRLRQATKAPAAPAPAA
jgi:hypothetical protein